MSLSELTPGEKAYLESGGEDASALMAENSSATPSEPASSPASDPAAAAESDPAAPAPAAPAPAVAAEPVELGEEEIPAADGKTKRRMVDSRALQQERKRRQALEEELRGERETRARVDERLRMLSEVVAQPETPAAPAAPEVEEAIIDPEQDIFGAYKQQQKRLERLTATIDELRNGQTEMRQQTEEERQTSALVGAYRRDADAFRAQQGDFNDAYNFLLQKRGEQLKALGYGDQEVAQALYGEEMNLATRAIGMRQSPSAQIYALARSMGYAPKAAEPAPVPAASVPAPGPAPAPAPAAAPSVVAEIDRIKAGQTTSRSLSSGAGAAGEELSLELLANMPDREFEAFMSKPGNRERVEMALGRRAA